MKRLRFFFIAVGLMSGIMAARAQTVKISGTVTGSDDGMPLPGVSVVVKGTSVGVATNIDGKYEFNAPSESTMLEFSFIGYESQTVQIAGRSVIDVALASSSEQLEEVMVVAYGTAKKSSFTGSVGSVSEKQLSKIQSSDPAKALEGALAGVSIVNATGQPGSNTTIRIRGIGSINASNSPLIIVDGAPYEGDLSSINNSDIETMNVLKDAASAALYGARGANGVIIITTKKGKSGETKVFAEARVGYNTRGVKEYDIMTSPSMYYETFWKSLESSALISGKDAATAAAYANNNLIKALGYNIYNVADNAIIANGKVDPTAKIKYKDSGWNDWKGALMSPQMRQEYNLNISKGDDNSKLFFSAGYLDDKGYSENSGFTRFSSKLSFETELYKWLDVTANMLFARTQSDWTQDGSSYTNSFMWNRNIAPIYPIYAHDAEGNVKKDQLGKGIFDYGDPVIGVNGTRAYGAATNPVATQKYDIDRNTDYYINENIQAKITLPYDLKFTTNASVYGDWYTYNNYITPIGGSGLAYNGFSYKQKYQTIAINWNQIIAWDHTFNDITVQAMLGHEYYKKKIDYIEGEKTNFLDPTNNEFCNAAKIGSLTSSSYEYALEGYFGQLTFDYNNKYYLSGSLRSDASSIFHPDNRWGTFWSIGASWRINREDFMSGVGFVDNLKLKTSYGAQGNDYLYLSGSTINRAYTPYLDLYSVTSNGTDLGFTPKYKGRKEVTWETNLNFNVGVEFALFGSLLTGEIEYFNRTTRDLLFNLPIPASTGFNTEPWNIGTMVNNGIEVTLNANIISTDDLRWSVNANLTHFKNEITKLPEDFKEDGITNGTQIIKEGGSIYDFWMVKYAGVNPENGDALYWKEKNDGSGYEKVCSADYDSNSRQFIGSSIPDFYGGFGTVVEYKGFDLSLQFSYQSGGLKDDGQYASLMHAGSAGDNWHTDILNAWSANNTSSNIPRLEYNNQGLIQASDRFITDASYIAFRNATLGYTLPNSLVNKLSISKLRVYFVVDNVALWSQRQGMDPRNSFSGRATDDMYSPIRTMSLGLVINL